MLHISLLFHVLSFLLHCILLSFYSSLFLSSILTSLSHRFDFCIMVLYKRILLVFLGVSSIGFGLCGVAGLVVLRASVRRRLCLAVRFPVSIFWSWRLNWAYCICSGGISFGRIQTLEVYNFLLSLLPIRVESRFHFLLIIFYLVILNNFILDFRLDLNFQLNWTSSLLYYPRKVMF